MNLKSTFLVAACITFYCQDVTASWTPANHQKENVTAELKKKWKILTAIELDLDKKRRATNASYFRALAASAGAKTDLAEEFSKWKAAKAAKQPGTSLEHLGL
jgi:hypothetical protein